MPVEIRDLVIKANIVEGNEPREGASKQESNAPAGILSQQERTQLIEDCVEQVMLLLNRMKDR